MQENFTTFIIQTVYQKGKDKKIRMQFYAPNITTNVSYEQGRIRFIVPFSNTNYIVSVVGEITFAYSNFTCYTLENVGRTKDSFVRQMRYQGIGQLRYGWENTFHFAVEGF